MKKKEKFLIIILIFLLCTISLELSFYFKKLKIEPPINEKNDEKKTKEENDNIDYSKYLVDIFTPYNNDNLERIFKVEANNLYYYLIDGLLDKTIQDKVNNKIVDTAKSLQSKYKDYAIASYIYSNFENTISIIFGIKDPEHFDHNSYQESVKNGSVSFEEVIYTLNIDLTTGNTITIGDVINDKNVLRNQLLKNVYESASKMIGLVCEGGPCENPKPDYSKLDDSVLSVMNKFNSDSYLFAFEPEGMTFWFKDVFMYNPYLDFTDESSGCSLEEMDGFMANICFDNYETKYSTFLSFIDLVDNTLIYDRFKTKKSIYQNPSTIIDRKFTTGENEYLDSRMVEENDRLIDYSIGLYNDGQIHNELKDVLYKQVTNESAELQTKDFNIYNVTGSGNYEYNNKYQYYSFYVYHYSIAKDEYEKYKRQIYLSKYRRCEFIEGDFICTYGYDYLTNYLDRKAYYYYIFDTEGNLLNTSDVISSSFDFSTVIPTNWLSLGKYSDIKSMLNDALIISNNDSFENNNHLVIYINNYPQDSENYLYLKYKGNKVNLAQNYQEYEEWLKKIFK